LAWSKPNFAAIKGKPKTFRVGKILKIIQMNILSKLIGIIAFVIMLLGLMPLLGLLNLIALPIAILGLIIGIFAKNNGGLILNSFVIIVAIMRLFVGGGVF